MSHQQKKSIAHSSHPMHSPPPDKLFRALIKESTEITLLLTVDGHITYSSPSAEDTFGYSAAELNKRSLFSLVHTDDRAYVQQAFEEIAQIPQSSNYIECRLCSQHGAWHWFEGATRNLIYQPTIKAIVCTFRDIALRKQQTEQLLQAQQQQLHAQAEQQVRILDAVLSAIPDFAYIFDLAGRFIYINQALLTLLERTKEQAIGKNFHELDYPFELATRLQSQIQEVILTKKRLKDETPFISPAGYLGYYEYIFVPILEEDGRVSAVAGSTRDISERHQVEAERQQLLEREQAMRAEADLERRRLHSLLMQAPIAIAILRGPEYIIELANPLMCHTMWRKEPDELRGKPLFEVLPSQEYYRDILAEVIKTGKPFIGIEIPAFFLQDGKQETVYYNFNCEPLRNVEGAIEGVIIISTDVSAQVTARKVIENNNTLLRFVADFMPQKVWTADAQGQFTYFNQRWTRYTGISEQELSQHWEQVSAPTEQEEQRRQWQHAVTTGQIFQYEHHLRQADGTYRWHLSRASAQTDAEGQIFMWIGTSTDIDKQKKQEEQKDAFISMASHELSTPLTTIKMALQIAERWTRNILQNEQAQLAETRQTILDISIMLNRSLRQVSIQTRLIKDLLDVSRIQQNKFSLLLETWDLKTVVQEAIEDQYTFTPKRSIELEELPQEPLPVRVDRERINQVLANYLSNALKYSPPAESIRVGIRREGRQVYVWVQDKGQGISAEQQEQIWERFYQVQGIEVKNGSSVGLGLGLHICQTIIEQHKGHVGVESRPGEGATFWFTLPLLLEDAPPLDEQMH